MASTESGAQYYAVVTETAGSSAPLPCQAYAAQGTGLPGTSNQPTHYVLFGLHAGSEETFVSPLVVSTNPNTGHVLSDVQIIGAYAH